MDMVAIMYRRLRKGMKAPFSPDRQHIHHLVMRGEVLLPPGICSYYARGGDSGGVGVTAGILSFCS